MAISRSASADYEIIFDIRTCRHFEIIKIKQGGNINSPPALSGTIPKIIILGIVIAVLFHFFYFLSNNSLKAPILSRPMGRISDEYPSIFRQ